MATMVIISEDSSSFWLDALEAASEAAAWVFVACFLFSICVNAEKYLNVYRLQNEFRSYVLWTAVIWSGVRLMVAIPHYSACNDGHIPYCYTFLADLFCPLYVALLLLGGFMNLPNAVLIPLYQLYQDFSNPITCWWLMIGSVVAFLYHCWAMCCSAENQASRVGLVHLNYVIFVHWALNVISRPAPVGYQWQNTESQLRNWELVIHCFAVLFLSGFMWKYMKREEGEGLTGYAKGDLTT